MIRPLRQRQRRIVIALCIFLPLAFALGIVARKPIPVSNPVQSGVSSDKTNFQNVEWQRGDLFTNSAVQVSVVRERPGDGKFGIAFSAPKDFIKPDLLVYWSDGNVSVTNVLPDNAVLLGAFSPLKLSLPDSLEKSEGKLILFSLADNEIVDVSKPVYIKYPPQ